MAEVFNFIVNDNRTITYKLTEPIMLEDNGVSDWCFHIPNIVNGLDATGWQWWLVYVNAKGEKYTIPLTLEYDYDRPDAYSIATYTVDYGMSCKVGSIKFSIEAIDADSVGGTILHEWHTKTYSATVEDTLQGNQVEYAETESDIISALLIEVRNRINQLVGGATPLPVASVSEMTDTGKVYLLTTDANWYYHNGTAWVSGGKYGAGIVDSTPTQGSTNAVQSGGVYDALTGKVDAETGKGLSTNDYSDAEKQKVTDATADLTAMTTATASDAGKALKAKTITGGKVTEWEFGETGDTAEIDALNEQMAMLITKTEKPQPEPTTIVQCVDLSQANLDKGGKRYNNVKIEMPWIGRYDMNPSNLNLRFNYMKPYDANGNVLQFYRNGNVFANLNCPQGGYFVKVDSRTIKTYASSGSLDWTWTADGDIAYLYNTAGYTGCIGDFTDPTQLVGVTFGGASENYIPYGDSETPDTPTEYEYKYSDELMSAVHDGIAENYTDEEPTQDSNNFVKSGGVISYLLKDTYNLVDPAWFDWSQEATASYIGLKTGLFIPAEAGRVLLSNAEKVSYKFYDATKTEIGSEGSAIAYAPITIPSGTSYMRMSLNNATGCIPSDHKVVIYYSEIPASPRDDIRGYIDHLNLQGMRGSNEIFDYYAPTALDKDILQMAKYSAVRNINFCNNIIRIGTCNMYLPRTTSGWKTFKKMFADFAVDIIGFQEVSNNNSRVLTEFLKGWQFTNGYTDAPVAVASHFSIISHNVYTTSVTGRKWTRAVIQLPRYADAINPTISVYDYHGIWDGGTPEKRAQEVAEILAVIAQDTSDFKIVVGDTNVQSPSEWDTWRNAGFTPVNDGNGVITTIDEYCLDNIFCGSGITCKNWHVVPAGDYLIKISGNDVPVSDHDFVFADLQLDFDALL